MKAKTRIIALPLVVTLPAYAAGDSIGGVMRLTASTEGGAEGVLLTDLIVIDAANQKPVMSLMIFDGVPASTSADNAAFAFGTGDAGKLVAKIAIVAADYTTTDSVAVAHLNQLSVGLVSNAGGSGDLYAVLVVDSGAPDFAAVTDLKVKLKIARE